MVRRPAQVHGRAHERRVSGSMCAAPSRRRLRNAAQIQPFVSASSMRSETADRTSLRDCPEPAMTAYLES